MSVVMAYMESKGLPSYLAWLQVSVVLTYVESQKLEQYLASALFLEA